MYDSNWDTTRPMRLFSALLISAVAFPSLAWGQVTGFTTNAPHAAIIDFETQELLFEKEY